MANENIPNIISTLSDRNLDTARTVDLGDSILLIGTSARGPVNQPIRVGTMADAEAIFGPITQGNLVRAFAEVFYGPNGPKDVRLCRISNGKKAILELEESSGNMEEKETYVGDEKITALRIEAREPGDIYNKVSFEMTNAVVDNKTQLSIVGTNPVSGLQTIIPYDPFGTKPGSVSDVMSLANAINLDPNLGSIVTAVANEINAEYELTITEDDVAPSGTFATKSGDSLIVDLGEALDLADANDDGYTDNEDVVFPSGVAVTSGNRLIRLSEVYELSNELVELDSSGEVTVQLPYPVQMESGVAKPFLKLDLSTGSSEAKQKVVNMFVGTADGEKTVFNFTAYETINASTVKVYRTAQSGTTVQVGSADFAVTKLGGSAEDYTGEITFNTAPLAGSTITISYESEIFTLTQSASLAAVKATNSYHYYFVAGDKVTFGTAQPTDIVIAYAAKKTYDIDVDVVISNAKEGKIQFTNPNKQPNFSKVGGTVIGFDYFYQPEWINLSSARSLQGGTNGIIMSNAQKYVLLQEAYDALADYEVDCVVPVATYLDDTKIVYDEETGIPTEVNAGFAQQLETYLTALQDGVNETYGIMAVKPAASARLEDVNEWFLKLTEPSTLDLTRAANIMSVLDAKHLSIVAFEPVIAHSSIPYPYVSTGECVYAGLVCKLPITSAPTNKVVGPQVQTMRFKLSARQLDKLTAMRYVTARLNTDGTWTITDAMTAAAVGSDYSRFSTLKITFEAMDTVRRSGRPFIGELFNPAKRAALETAIQRGLMDMQTAGALRKFDFKIEQTPAERVAGIARITLVLYPEFELRRIVTTVKLSNTNV